MTSQQRVSLLTACLTLCLLRGAAWGQKDPDSSAPTIQWQPKHVLKFQDRPSALSFSRDGRRFACNDGRSARIWDTRTWKEIGGFTEREQLMGVVGLSPDGRTLAFTSNDGIDIHLLDVASGKVLRTLRGHTSSCLPRFSPDGKTIASTAFGDGVKLWDVETGKDLGRFPVRRKTSKWEEERLLTFSPDGGTLAVATEGGEVHLLDVQQGKEVRSVLVADPVSPCPRSLAFSPDGRYLALGVNSVNTVTVWDVPRRKVLWELQWPIERDPRIPGEIAHAIISPEAKRLPGIWRLAFSADNRTLVASCQDRRLRVWELATGKLRYRVEVAPVFLEASSAGPFFATTTLAQETRQVFIWDLRTGVPLLRPSGPVNPEKIWADLGSHDAALVYKRIRELASIPKEASTLLDKRLPTAMRVKPSTIEVLIRELDEDRFDVRDHAQRRLEELAEVAQTTLSQALTKNLSAEARKRIQELLARLEEPLTGDRLRFVRAVEVLETIGSPESCQVLERLAGGDPSHLLTRQANAALQRLNVN